MANAFQTVDWMAMESLDLLLNQLSIAAQFNTDYDKEFDREFAIGNGVRVKKPQRFTVRDGLGYQEQSLNRLVTTVNLQAPFGIDFGWDSYERAVAMEKGEAALKREYLEPAMAQLAQEIDSRCALWAYQNTNNIVGQLGTDPVDFDTTSAAARQRMVELGGAPKGKTRSLFVPPNVMRALKKSAIGYFNPVTDISKQFRTGIVGAGDGFEWYESMSLYSHTAGTWAGAVTVATGSIQGASTIALTVTTGDTVNVGDVFTISAVNQVNPMTRRKTTTVLKPFVVTQAAVGVAGAMTVAISPTIYGPGSQYQNVDALPLAGATLTLFPGTTTPNGKSGVNGLAIGQDAFALVGIELEKPKGSVEVCVQQRDPETGIAVRFLRQFDGQLSKMINRFDVCIGLGNLYSDEESVRILGA